MPERRTLADLGEHSEAIARMAAHAKVIVDERSQRMLTEKQIRMSCDDCGGHSDLYMLTDEVWLSIHPSGKKGMLCMLCAQMRLGRPFRLSDFTSALANLPILVGYGMGIAARGEIDA